MKGNKLIIKDNHFRNLLEKNNEIISALRNLNRKVIGDINTEHNNQDQISELVQIEKEK